MPNEQIDLSPEGCKEFRVQGCGCCPQNGEPYLDDSRCVLPALLDALEEAMQERDAALMALRSCSTVIMEWGHGLEEAQEIADRIIAAHADLKSENTALKVQVDALMQTIEENENAHNKRDHRWLKGGDAK